MEREVWRIQDQVAGDGAYRTAWHRMSIVDPDIFPLSYDEYGNSVEYPEYPSYYINGGDHDEYHPAARLDGLDTFPDRYIFGFDSEESMRAWFFREERDSELLDRWGLEVVVYIVDEIYIIDGGSQLVFDPNEADVVRKISTTEF